MDGSLVRLGHVVRPDHRTGGGGGLGTEADRRIHHCYVIELSLSMDNVFVYRPHLHTFCHSPALPAPRVVLGHSGRTDHARPDDLAGR